MFTKTPNLWVDLKQTSDISNYRLGKF